METVNGEVFKTENLEYNLGDLLWEKVSPEIREIMSKLYQELIATFQNQKLLHNKKIGDHYYTTSPADWQRQFNELALILEQNGPNTFRNKKVLDIGCGAIATEVDNAFNDFSSSTFINMPEFNERGELKVYKTPWHCVNSEYEPWFGRLTTLLGAKVIGLDIRDNEKENFESYRLDLTIPGAMNFLDKKSFDFIHSSRFKCSPSFNYVLRKRRSLAASILDDIFEKQPARLIRPKGIICIST